MTSSRIEKFSYDDAIVRRFVSATLIWGLVAFLAGLVAALQLASWKFNFGLEWITFGRLRPLHTNAAIFAFGGNSIFAGIYYSTQRLTKARMFNDVLSRIHFWGWQLIIVCAALTIPLGISTGKEYAELEWPIDILITLVWVVFAVNFFGTLYRRRERHIYVALWFYIATIITVALLHVVNSLELPVSFLKSYSIYGGAQDALIQWWYGHNAVAFFLTTPFLGLMYYYLPKAADRPVYSYRLSIIHFWALVFIYIWAGPHHLLYTSVPDWAQTLGMIFSVMLWMPSWGGMINGLLTLRGVWDRVRTDPVLKYFVAGLTFYGMSTFEGPLLSVKSVNALAHYSDWIIGHVHGGTLGWNGFITFAMIYWLVPKLWKRPIHSLALANAQFWLQTIGIILYVASMWASGITQGLMLRAINEATGKLMYPDFVETVLRIAPLYWVRMTGGLFFITGYILMLVNVGKTIKGAKAPVDEVASAPALTDAKGDTRKEKPHRRIEGLPAVFAVLTFLAVLSASLISIVPSFFSTKFHAENPGLKPYTALELHGRDVYLREGCYNCHSQMIRPMLHETMRYGDYSRVQESMYDHPFQWGSRRTGPDLARLGGKYPDLWHFRHLLDPREVVPGSLMPSYPWLFSKTADYSQLSKKLAVMKKLGVPYTDEQIASAERDAEAQAKQVSSGLRDQGAPAGMENKEINALIAYLQRLGQDHKKGLVP